ncbi:hypothetical protein D3C78_1289430 [compost metagenome]
MAQPGYTLLLALRRTFGPTFTAPATNAKRGRSPSFLDSAPGAYLAPPLRMALKNSDDDGSSTITSLFLLKLAL